MRRLTKTILPLLVTCALTLWLCTIAGASARAQAHLPNTWILVVELRTGKVVTHTYETEQRCEDALEVLGYWAVRSVYVIGMRCTLHKSI